MPINSRPRQLSDVFRVLFDQGASPTVASPGQVVHAVLLTRSGVTTLGLSFGLPSIARAATWIAVGDGAGTPGAGDTALFHETARAPVQPFLSAPGQTIAIALLSAVHGTGILTEMGLYGAGSHGSATVAAGSGTLYAHTMFDRPFLKNCSKLVSVEWAES